MSEQNKEEKEKRAKVHAVLAALSKKLRGRGSEDAVAEALAEFDRCRARPRPVSAGPVRSRGQDYLQDYD